MASERQQDEEEEFFSANDDPEGDEEDVEDDEVEGGGGRGTKNSPVEEASKKGQGSDNDNVADDDDDDDGDNESDGEQSGSHSDDSDGPAAGSDVDGDADHKADGGGDDGSGDEKSDGAGGPGDGEGDDDDANNAGLSEYELLRLERIKRNRERLIQLGLESREEGGGVLGRKKKKPRVQRRKSNETAQPTRKSRRSVEQKSYAEPSLRGLLQTVKGSGDGGTKKEKKPAKAAKKSPSSEALPPRKPSKVDLRPTREIYDEFKRIRRHKRQSLAQAQMYLRRAEKEVSFWHKRSAVANKKRSSGGEPSAAQKSRDVQLAKEKEMFGGLSAQEFLGQIVERKEEIEAKMDEYDFRAMTPEQKMEAEAKRVEHQNKLKLLEAKDVVTKGLETMATALSSCLVDRTPRDRPPPRRSRRGAEVETRWGDDDEADGKPSSKKRGRKKVLDQQHSQNPSASDSQPSRAATQASLSQTQVLHQQSFVTEEGMDNPCPTTTNDGSVEGSKKRREVDVGGWVSGPFAARIDRAWLDQDAPQPHLDSVETYVPQSGDTLLYYPAGHFQFLNKYPDHLCNGRIDRLPLWERASKERAKASEVPGGKASNWYTRDWIDIAGSGKDLLPILCRVVKTQAEFPRDSSQGPDNDNQASAAATSGAPLQSKSRKRPVLRLAVTLQPLTPITPPLWTDAGPDDTASVDVPPVFTCVTFPSPLPAFLVPFAWSYIRNQSLVVGEEVLHSPAKASVTGKPLHQKGKLLSLSTIEGDYGSFRLDDKLDYMANALSTLKKKKDEEASEAASDSSQKVGSLVRVSPLDAFVVGDFFEGFLRKHGAPTTVDKIGINADMMTLVRATFPIWMGASIQRGLEDRTRLEQQPWDLKVRSGPVGSDIAFKKFLDFGHHNTLDSMLRLKIECSIEEYIQATPTASPFQEQISEADAPNYRSAVPITMSFRRILGRLKQRGKRPSPNSPCYYRNVNAILEDIQAIEDNCRRYNASDSLVTRSAIEVVANAKECVSGIVTTHVREFTDKLKEEDTRKQFLAAFVGENSGSLENAAGTQTVANVDPFQDPWKGPLFRDWVQLTGQKHRGSNFTQWVPQAGDTVLYSRDIHARFVDGHLDSLSANQSTTLDDSIWNGLDAAVSKDARVVSSSCESKWVAAKILSVRAEFPRASERGSFVTDAPLLALRVQLSGVSSGGKQTTSVIYWRPCMFPSDISDEMDPETVCCKSCGVQISTSYLRPPWGNHFENDLQRQGGESSVGLGVACNEIEQIERNINFLKKRCLLHVVPDKFDANLSTEQIRNGYFPAPYKVNQNALPKFDDFLKAAEAEADGSSRFASKQKANPLEIDTSALSTLAAVGFLPPWLPQVHDVKSTKKKASATLLHDSISPCPNLCLELILLRIKNGYYRHLTAIHNDLVEAFLNTQFLSWAHAAKRKSDLKKKKLAKALSFAKYAITTDDTSFTLATQAVTGTQKSAANEAMAPIRVRIVLEDPKENRGVPIKDRNAAAKPAKKLAKHPSPAKASGKKRKQSSPSAQEENEMVLTAEVPMGTLQSLGRQEAVWAQCDKCKKWRRLRGLGGDQKLPSRWYCSMNKSDPGRALCSAPEEEYDDVDNEIVTGADAPEDAFSEEERSFVAHAELVRRLYAAALVGITEPSHFAVVFGLTSLHVNRQRILSTIVPETFTQADHQAAFARYQLGSLMEAIARDPCKSKLPQEVTLKVFVDGDLIKGEKFLARDPETPVSVDGFKFGKRYLRSNNKLTRVLIKPADSNPCIRCQAARKGLFTCRVLRSHSNAAFDLYQNFKGGGGLDGLLCTMLKLPLPSPKVPLPNKPLSSGESDGVGQSQSVSSAVAGEEDEKRLADDGGGVARKTTTASECDGTEHPHDGAAGDGKENADDEKNHCEEMHSRSKAAFELAEEIKAMAEAYAEAPVRLSNHFIATTFPFDPRDSSYAFCIICGLPGDLLLCDKHGCPNVMHRHCGGLSEVPKADWFCGQCVPIPLNGDDAKEHATTAATAAAKISPPNQLKSEDDLEVHKADTDAVDAAGVSQGTEEKTAAVTSSLPPIATFDDEKASKLSSELDDLYVFRTGRRRGEKAIAIGTLFQKKFGHQGYFTGEVMEVPTQDHPFYAVRYQEDGDEEDLTEEALQELLTKTKEREESVAKKNIPPPQEDEDESGNRSRGRPRKRLPENADEGSGRSKRSRPTKSPATAKKAASSDGAERDDDGDPLLRLVEVMQEFLATQNIETAEAFMGTKTGDLAQALVKWRAKKRMPALKGSGAVATISAAKTQVRRVVSERGWDPLPEMTRSGKLVRPGDEGGGGDKDASSSSTSNNEQQQTTPRREGKRRSRPPDRLG